METWLSWGLVIAIAGAAYFYYSQKGTRVQTRGRSTVPKTPVEWVDNDTKTKAAAKSKTKKANKTADKPAKSVKSAVQEVGKNVEAYLSSTAGADADDDLTPATSPVQKPVQNPSGKNVSDMLEPQAARQILKIGASEKPARPAKPQPQRSETQEKTKKQRQNERKKEEAKAAREAAEEERKKLLEQQRRTAREARGEPARNGLQQAQAPTSNPWSRPATQAAAPAVPANGQLLDTIDNVSTASSSEAATNGTAPTPDSMSYSNLPPEEDQMRMVMEDSAWTTVNKGKKSKKAKAVDEGSDSGVSPEPAPAPAPAPAKASKPAPAKKAENVKPASRFEVLSPPVTEASHPMDSDWPVV